jgi:hypothetical protein
MDWVGGFSFRIGHFPGWWFNLFLGVTTSGISIERWLASFYVVVSFVCVFRFLHSYLCILLPPFSALYSLLYTESEKIEEVVQNICPLSLILYILYIVGGSDL